MERLFGNMLPERLFSASVAVSGNALIAADFGGNVYTFCTRKSFLPISLFRSLYVIVLFVNSLYIIGYVAYGEVVLTIRPFYCQPC